MIQVIQRLPFLITLLVALLIGNTTTVVNQELLHEPLTLAAKHDSRPDAALENFLPSFINSRVLLPEPQSRDAEPCSWPLALLTIAALLALFCIGYRQPRSYLSSPNHRLAGWQDSNLQYRFIHSR